MIRALAARPALLPSLGIVLGGALWGLFWLPVRALGEMGLEGAWPGAMIYLGCTAALTPVVVLRWRQLIRHARVLAVCGLLTGTAFATYSASLLMTEVVRVILLFYLTPVWATLMGIAFLGERLTLGRAVALVMGVGGMLVVLGIGERLPWPHNLGDWLALASGVAWAWGSMELYRSGGVPVVEQITAFVLGSLAVTFAGIIFGGAAFGGWPPLADLGAAVPLGFLAGLYVVPMLVLTIWPATLLSPGRIGILLMSDVVVGVISAALLSGEPFGLREALGTVLIVGAAVVEVLGHRDAGGVA
ncbi:MAG TPA: DMT family transporter [Thermohalobaculum sp.]|nr:DMT family transporter [Thermohalobaculum sp.]